MYYVQWRTLNAADPRLPKILRMHFDFYRRATFADVLWANRVMDGDVHEDFMYKIDPEGVLLDNYIKAYGSKEGFEEMMSKKRVAAKSQVQIFFKI